LIVVREEGRAAAAEAKPGSNIRKDGPVQAPREAVHSFAFRERPKLSDDDQSARSAG
jgi:hypothetical protein